MASSALEKTEEEKEYKAFKNKVKRTVYVDNLSPKVEKKALSKAFEQHGNVVEVEFIPTYREWIPFPDIPSKRALVVMENEQQAKNIIDTLNEYPFMICGMPRPVRAFPAFTKMFPFRPPPPDRKIMCSWIGPDDPNFARAQKEKELVMKHSQEVEFLHYCQQQEEEKLAEKHEQALRADMKKYTTLEKVVEKSVGRLAKAYNLDIPNR